MGEAQRRLIFNLKKQIIKAGTRANVFIVALNLKMENAPHFDRISPRRVFYFHVPESLVGHALLGMVNASLLGFSVSLFYFRYH